MTAVVLPPARPRCALCDRGHSRRRDLCWSCYRKLRACGLALPECGQRGRRWPDGRAEPLALLVATVRQWPPAARARLRIALAEVDTA